MEIHELNGLKLMLITMVFAKDIETHLKWINLGLKFGLFTIG